MPVWDGLIMLVASFCSFIILRADRGMCNGNILERIPLPKSSQSLHLSQLHLPQYHCSLSSWPGRSMLIHLRKFSCNPLLCYKLSRGEMVGWYCSCVHMYDSVHRWAKWKQLSSYKYEIQRKYDLTMPCPHLIIIVLCELIITFLWRAYCIRIPHLASSGALPIRGSQRCHSILADQ